MRLPHYTFAQFDLGRTVARSGLRPGDLVFFDDVAHVGLYIGHNRFIHAPHSGAGYPSHGCPVGIPAGLWGRGASSP